MHPTCATQYPQFHSTRCGSKSISMLAGCLLVGAAASHAHTFCVGTAAALQSALTAASDNGANDNEDNTIEIVRGTYSTTGNGNAEFGYNNQTTARKLDIGGGYTTGCVAHIDIPTLSILDGGGTTRVLESESTAGDVSLRYLTLQNGNTSESGGGLLMNSFTGANGPIIVEYNIIQNNHSSADAGGFEIAVEGSATLHFENNLVVGNRADLDLAGGEMIDYGAGTFIVNNTISGNTVTGNPMNTGGGMGLSTGNADTLSNNIFWGNSGYDLETAGSGVVLMNNDIGNPVPSGNGNLSVDPRFGGGGNYQLAATSPLLGMGTTTPVGGLPTIDLNGNPRSYNGLVDMGAYEHGDEIFGDGFED
jgi:hypothetical protein